LTAGAQNPSLTDTGELQFDARSTGGNNQINTLTVMNTGKTPITITNAVTTIERQPVNPWHIVPGEDCKGATLLPIDGYCVVSVEFSPVAGAEVVLGTVVVTAADGSTDTADLDASDVELDSLTANPIQLDYGSRNVGTTSAAQQITLGASPNAFDYEPLSITAVNRPGQPAAAGDYHKTSDNCTNLDMFFGNDGPDGPLSCQIGETVAPTAGGSRPAFLDVAYCDPFDFGRGEPSGGGSEVPLPPPAVGPGHELICGPDDGRPIMAKHLLIGLTATGVPTGTTTTNPFAPTLTASPPLAPAGRTTLLTGTGFPDNTTVTLGLVPAGTPTTASLAGVPGTTTVTTNGIGGFSNLVMLIMPHTTSGQYEILAQAAPTATATVAFLVTPGTQEPPKFVTRH
jgi:hypothetical protein